MRILGIDPGYATVGTAVADYDGNRFVAVDYRAVTTAASLPFSVRLQAVHTDIKALITEFRPECMAIEELFFTKNLKTGIAVAQARGVILLAAREAGLAIHEYTPLQIKQGVTGYGKATKKQVQEMTRIIYGLPSVPRPDDVADALAVAICHGHCARGRRLNSEGEL